MLLLRRGLQNWKKCRHYPCFISQKSVEKWLNREVHRVFIFYTYTQFIFSHNLYRDFTNPSPTNCDSRFVPLLSYSTLSLSAEEGVSRSM